MPSVNPKLVEIALEHAQPTDFERFVQAFYPAIVGIDFVATGGTHDGGADAYQDTGLFEGKRVGTFYQASITDDYRAKIRHTVARLREVGRNPTSLVYVTSRPISAPDQEEEALGEELSIFLKIRSRAWIVTNVNHSPRTISAFDTYLSSSVEFVKHAGGATLISSTKHLQSRSIAVFLGQEVERRRSKSPLIESIADSLILWALDKTDADTNCFLTRSEILQKIEEKFPASKQFMNGVIDHRINALSSKGNTGGREIRWYRKEGKACLPFETRQLIEAENIDDEYMMTQVVGEFDLAAQRLLNDFGTSPASGKIAHVIMAAIELCFVNNGLELAAFLTVGGTEASCPPVADNIDVAIQEHGLTGTDALTAKEVSMILLRRAFYESTDIQREYFGKLSRTYALLFSLQADPRTVEYFQNMSSEFVLFVGTDILVRALAEHYLRPQDRMTCNLLEVLRAAGSKLILCDTVLDEVHRHLETTDWEFINYCAAQEPYIDLNLARHSTKILIRSYFYAKLTPAQGVRPPPGWKSFIGQFCDYASLHNSHGKRQLQQYLTKRFGMEFLPSEELAQLAPEADVQLLANDLKPFKREVGNEILALNDARLILGVYGMRRRLREEFRGSPYGFATWWLTQETRVQLATATLVSEKGAKYIIRPDFLLNYIALSPSTEDVRNTFRSVMPTLLGVQLSNRMREDIFHELMSRVADALSVDEARAAVIMADLSNRLKGDAFKQYETQWEKSGH